MKVGKRVKRLLTKEFRDLWNRPVEFEESVNESIEEKCSLKHLFDLSQDMLCVSGFDGYARLVSPSFEKVLGYTTEEILAEPLLNFVHPEDREKIVAELKVLSNGKKIVYSEQRCLCKDGSYKWLLWNNTPDVEKGLMYAAARDITDYKKMEGALKESKKTLRTLLNAPTDVLFMIDTEGNILDINETAAKRFERSIDELRGMCAWELFPPDVAEKRRAYTNKVIETGNPVRFEDERHGIWSDSVVYPIYDLKGNVKKIVVVARDITDLKRYENLLKESEKKYKELVENIEDIMYITDEYGRFKFINSALERLSGYTRDELINESFEKILTNDSFEYTKEIFKRYRAKENIGTYELNIYNKEGRIRTIETKDKLVMGGNRVIEVCGIGRDITERKQVEEMFRDIFENVTDFVYLLNGKGKIIFTSRSIRERLGYSSDEMENMYISELIAPTSIKYFEDIFKRQLMGEEIGTYEIDVRNKDGKIFTVEIREKPVWDSGRVVEIYGIARDITNRKMAEKRLIQIARGQATILNNMSEQVFYIDREMKIIWANRVACNMAGLAREELVGSYCYGVLNQLNEPCKNCIAAKALEAGEEQKAERTSPNAGKFNEMVYPILDVSGDVNGFALISLGVTKGDNVNIKPQSLSLLKNDLVYEEQQIFLAPLDPNYIYPFSLYIDYQSYGFVITLFWDEFNQEIILKRLMKSETSTARFLYLAAKMKSDKSGWVDKEVIRVGNMDIHLKKLRSILERANIPFLDKLSARMIIRSSKENKGKVRLAISPSNIDISDNIKLFKSNKYVYLDRIQKRIDRLEKKGNIDDLEYELNTQKKNRINTLKSIETVEYLLFESIKMLENS